MEVLNRYPGTTLKTNPDGSKRLSIKIIYKFISDILEYAKLINRLLRIVRLSR